MALTVVVDFHPLVQTIFIKRWTRMELSRGVTMGFTAFVVVTHGAAVVMTQSLRKNHLI